MVVLLVHDGASEAQVHRSARKIIDLAVDLASLVDTTRCPIRTLRFRDFQITFLFPKNLYIFRWLRF